MIPPQSLRRCLNPWLLLAGLVLLGAGTLALERARSAPAAPAVATDLTFPLRGAFVYQWFPETWTVNGAHVFYRPTLGYYDSSAQSVTDAHIRALGYGKFDVAITSWWGPGTHQESTRIPLALSRTAALASPLRWTAYYEREGSADPTVTEIQNDLAYLSVYASDPAWARIGGKPVIFVYSANESSCAVADRWAQAAAGWHVVLKIFTGWRTCPAQPQGWHQYAPAGRETRQFGYSFTISPGFWRADEATPRLGRDPGAWRQDVAAMDASGEPWQLVTTFNEFGEGTAVEAAEEWISPSGYGTYLDALHEPPPAAPPPSDPVIAAAGDIACDPANSSFRGGLGSSSSCHQKYTSDLLVNAGLSAVLPLGDNQYYCAGYQAFVQSYDLSWGRLKEISQPVAGNHEYLTTGGSAGSGATDCNAANAGAAGYFRYFGAAAGDPAKGYYSYDIGTWHLIALNGECSQVGGCGPTSPQGTWLQADLAAHTNFCTLAYWHKPLFSSAGGSAASTSSKPFWDALHAADADIILSAHAHRYERFAPQTPAGAVDPVRGIREFVVGTGGANRVTITAVAANSEVRSDSTFGVLKLTLHPTSYVWQFVPEVGASFTDSGTTNCHGTQTDTTPPTAPASLTASPATGSTATAARSQPLQAPVTSTPTSSRARRTRIPSSQSTPAGTSRPARTRRVRPHPPTHNHRPLRAP
jgi:hypothetical protein